MMESLVLKSSTAVARASPKPLPLPPTAAARFSVASLRTPRAEIRYGWASSNSGGISSFCRACV
jgi:hypothetical protein